MQRMRYRTAIAIAIAVIGSVMAACDQSPTGAAVAERSIERRSDFMQCTWIGGEFSECHMVESVAPTGCDDFGNCQINCVEYPLYCQPGIAPPANIGGTVPPPPPGGGDGSGSTPGGGGSNPTPPTSPPPPPPAPWGFVEGCYPVFDPGCILKQPWDKERTAFQAEVDRLRALGWPCTQLADKGQAFINKANGILMYDGPRSSINGDSLFADTHGGEIHISRHGSDGVLLSSRTKAYKLFRHEVKHQVFGWPNPDNSAAVPPSHRCD